MMGKRPERPMPRNNPERTQRNWGDRNFGRITTKIVAAPKIEMREMYMI